MTVKEFHECLIKTLTNKNIKFNDTHADKVIINDKVTITYIENTDIHVTVEKWMGLYILSMSKDPQELVDTVLSKTKVTSQYGLQ